MLGQLHIIFFLLVCGLGTHFTREQEGNGPKSQTGIPEGKALRQDMGWTEARGPHKRAAMEEPDAGPVVPLRF